MGFQGAGFQRVGFRRCSAQALTAAGLVLALCGTVLPAHADTPKADAPATAAPVSDPAAKQALMDAAAAVRAITSMSFKAKEATELGSIKTRGEVSVKLSRSAAGVVSYRLEGFYEAPAFPRRQVVGAVLEGKTVQWLQVEDESGTKEGKQVALYTGKTLYERPLGAPESGVSRVTLPNNTFKEVFLNTDPFRQEIDAVSLSMEKPQTINGEECLVIKAVLNRGNIERLVYISAIDKLPRRYVRLNYASGSRLGGQTLDFSDLSMEKEFKLADVKLAAPAGYRTDTKTVADYPSMTPPPVVPNPPQLEPVPSKRTPAVPAMTPEQEEEMKRQHERDEEEKKNPSKEPSKSPSKEPSKEPKK